MSLLSNLGKLRPETDEQRAAGATVGPADIAELKARVDDLKLPGLLLDEGGNVQTFPASEAREMLEATKEP
jgi:hypothetical protein